MAEARLQHRLQRWQNARQPRIGREELNQRNLYILPTLYGLQFVGVAILIWLLGTNYENNLVLLLSFLLIALFVSSIFATHRNLEGLSLQIGDADPVFAGQELEVPLLIHNPGTGWRRQLEVFDGERQYRVDVAPHKDTRLLLRLPTTSRGWQKVPRLRVAGVFPLGLLRCWSWPCLTAKLLAYPAPVEQEMTRGDEDGIHGRGSPAGRGIDDFAGLEEWRPGVPAQRIAWKQYSAGRGMLEKRFEAVSRNPAWLDFDAYPGLDTEARLSALCAKALEMERRGQAYGLKLGRVRIAPALGDRHLRELLTALALFGDSGEQPA